MKAFTLMEMLIVLIIMGIITMMTMGFTGDQLQKLQQKTVKEAMLSDYQSHYTKNLTSSRYAGQNYTGMTITFKSGSDTIQFEYVQANNEGYHIETFSDTFELNKISTNPNGPQNNLGLVPSISLTFKPYQSYCKMSEGAKQIALVFTIRKQKQYCFSISAQLCRMIEVPCNPNWMYEG